LMANAATQRQQDSSSELIVGMIALAGILLAAFFLLIKVLRTLFDFSSWDFEDPIVLVILSVFMVIAGWLAFQLRKHWRTAYALIEITFALASNWVMLTKLGPELEKSKAEYVSNLQALSNPEGAPSPRPRPYAPPVPAQLIFLVSLTSGTYL